MEMLVVKIDSKKNSSFLKKLLLKFNFVLEVKSTTSEDVHSVPEKINVAGSLNKFSDLSKMKNEKAVWEKVILEKHGTY